MSNDNKEGAGVPVAVVGKGNGGGVGITYLPALYSLPHGTKLYATPPAVMPAAPSDAFATVMRNIFGNEFPAHPNSAGEYPGWSDHWEIFQAGAAISQTMQPQAEPAAGEQAGAVAETEKKTHGLKTDPDVFDAVWNGLKTFEIRFNDRDFKVGDWLNLHETKHSGEDMKAGLPLIYTGRSMLRKVSHVLSGYGLAEGWVCLSLAAPGAAIAAREQEALPEPVMLSLFEGGDKTWPHYFDLKVGQRVRVHTGEEGRIETILRGTKKYHVLIRPDYGGTYGAWEVTPLASREEAPATPQAALSEQQLFDIIRGTGYVTRGQAWELAELILAAQA